MIVHVAAFISVLAMLCSVYFAVQTHLVMDRWRRRGRGRSFSALHIDPKNAVIIDGPLFPRN